MLVEPGFFRTELLTPESTTYAVAAQLQQATDSLPCPDTSIYAPFPQNSGEPQSCHGGSGHNSFYGAGQINALKAVS